MNTRFKSILLAVVLGSTFGAFNGQLAAQSLTTGSVEGTVTDQSGAVIAAASVTLTSDENGSTRNDTTRPDGQYRFALLKPGTYTVDITQAGFQKYEQKVVVAVGQPAVLDAKLVIGQATQTVEVSADVPVISPDPSEQTNFSQAQMALLPSGGADITNIAFTAPGVVVNTTGGYGNFTANGLPATSNLFTVNGENDMDPYFNINNSGASNLTLGQNEIQEATVSEEPYSGQFGQLAGAQVTYVTKSGSNAFHGNLIYYWNGRAVNSNDWFNNYYGTPRPFSNQNQWAGSLGGPIVRDKTFFFFDTEGLRFIIPNTDDVIIPSPQFATAVVNNLNKVAPAEVPAYTKMFSLYSGIPGAANGQPLDGGCDGLSQPLPGFNPATTPCALQFTTTPSALASEWIMAFRIDQRLGNNDNVYFRYKQDRGTQPTEISAVSPVFDAISKQPSWDTQLNETHIFGPRATNSFMATLSYYSALFSMSNEQEAVATFPYDLAMTGTVPFTNFNSLRDFPQGRNITQYQFIDDYSLTLGKHNLKFGENFRRYDVSDHSFYYNYPLVYFGYSPANDLSAFANGLAYQYRRAINESSDVPIAMWGIGVYGQDEWNVTPNLKLTLALRAEHNSNPVCQTNCFTNFTGTFSSLASYTAADPSSVPYSADMLLNQHRAYPGVDPINWSPRIGFSWSPTSSRKTVFSGGFGLFYDNAPAGLVDDLLSNPPLAVQLRVRPASGTHAFDPAGAAATFAASASAFNVNSTYAQIAAAMSAQGVAFTVPSFTSIVGTLHSPEWQEWNFQIQHQFGNDYAMVINYAGNHGVKIPYLNTWPNAYDEFGLFPGVSAIPSAPPVANYGTVTQVQSGAVSNYNGLSISFRKRFTHGFAADVNYTWSHNLDEVSNGGVFTYGDSLLGQNNPYSLYAGNYGNSDYDVRHLLNADVTYAPGWRLSNRMLNSVLGGWQWAMKLFWHTGLPFSVTDESNIAAGNYGSDIMAQPLAGNRAQTGSCGAAAANVPCVNSAAFLDTSTFSGYTYFPFGGRNTFRGSNYFDTDMSLYKNFSITERLKFAIGAQAFNVFNHPNFNLPDYNLGDANFGKVTSMFGTPTSPYGNFLGFDSSVRTVQISGKLTF